MATVTPNFNWPVPTSTDLVKDGATAIEALGDSIDASLVDLKGGTTGQVLSKNSNTDMDFTWVTNADGDITGVTAGTGLTGGGTSGTVTVAVDPTYAGFTNLNYFANPVINSAFQVWQRGTSFTATSVYTADRWYKGGNTPHTFSRQLTNDTTNLPNIQYCLRAQRDSGSSATGIMQLANMFETVNSIPYAGKTIAFSFYARAGANYSPTSSLLSAQVRTGTGTDQNLFSGYTGSATPITVSATLTSTWQRFQGTATLSSSATEVCVYFESTPTGTAGANDYYEVTGVQIDIGSVALPFRTNGPTYEAELAGCQRYYYRLGAGGGGNTSGTQFGYYLDATASSSTNLYGILDYAVTMRKTPTSVDYSNVGWIGSWGAGVNAISAIAIYDGSNVVGSTPHSAVFTMTTTGATTNSRYFVLSNNSTAGYLGVSAEL
jgi:hypothetical protein